MSKFAGVSELNAGRMTAALDATGTTITPEPLRPKLGPLAALDYTPVEFRYHAALSSAPSQGSVTVRLKADGTTIREETVDLNGVSELGNSIQVSLAGVDGAARLATEIEVTAAADSGITAELQSVIAVEQPVVISGC